MSRLLVFLFLLPLVGCATSPMMLPFRDLGQSLGLLAAPHVALPREPQYTYLKVEHGHQMLYMVLAFVDASDQGLVETWYTGSADVLKLLDGRVVGIQGGGVNWSGVRFEGRPAWLEITQSVSFDRVRDDLTGYRHGHRDRLTVRPVDPPAAELKHYEGTPEGLRWFVETSDDPDLSVPTYYAVRPLPVGARVVYTSTCLSPTYCLRWQAWQHPAMRGVTP